jgi:hypothetical protein
MPSIFATGGIGGVHREGINRSGYDRIGAVPLWTSFLFSLCFFFFFFH